MLRALTILFLCLTFAFGVQAQRKGLLASARERGFKGKVNVVESKCSDIKGKHETRLKFEYDRDGNLIVIETPQWKGPIIRDPRTYKITKRNNRGDVEEVSFFFVKGEFYEKERYEYEYDSVGNWVKEVTFLMREYEMEGGDWKAGEWQARYVCTRKIEYYP